MSSTNTKLCLLMPAIHATSSGSDNIPTSSPVLSPHLPRALKTSPGKLARSHSHSHTHASQTSVSQFSDISRTSEPLATDVGTKWLGHPLRFQVVDPKIELEGFQMHAVEKWIVERTRPVTVLTVYTGQPAHKILVTALSPVSTLPPDEAQEEWLAALHYLRKDGARPVETPFGTIMATSLAHFRSDYTIVRIPNGDMLSVREQLYANINLLRMGCSGRSALTLEEPSETTKDRFVSMYHLPEIPSSNTAVLSAASSPIRSPRIPYSFARESLDTDSVKSAKVKDLTIFNATVLELVKLIQAGLFICGAINSDKTLVMDGLLCDVTVEGIQNWISDVGEACAGIEPTERIADPLVVSALLSIILSNRNKIAALGYGFNIPKDPFLRPQAFVTGLSQYLHHLSTPPPSHGLPTIANPHLAIHTPPFLSYHSSASVPLYTTTSFLNRSTIETISAAYDKNKQGDHRKVHRVLWNKLDDLTGGGDKDKEADNDPDPNSNGDTSRLGLNTLATGLGLVSGAGGGAACVLEVMTDLESFTSLVVGKDKNAKKKVRTKTKSRDWNDSTDLLEPFSVNEKVGGVGGSVRALWSGRVTGLVKLRQTEQERAEKWDRAMPREERDKPREKERPSGSMMSDKEDDRLDAKSTEDEAEFGAFAGRPWSGRVQKKIESWASLGRRRGGPSVDLSMSAQSSIGRSSIHGSAPASIIHAGTALPTVALTRSDGEEEDLLSSGNVSPNEEHKSGTPFRLHSAENSALSIPDAVLEWKASQLPHKRPWSKRMSQSRVTSWSDPISARSKTLSASGMRGKRKRSGSRLGVEVDDFGEESEVPTEYFPQSSDDVSTPVRLPPHLLKRRASFHSLTLHQSMKVLPVERMRIDVELCGQMLIMSRREEHLRNVLRCLQVITSSIEETNTFLRSDYESYVPIINGMEDRTKIIADIESERVKADATSQETKTLLYESALFRVSDLWHMVTPPRQKVFALRDKVFGMGGRRLPPGVDGAHGSFNRQQWTLDGQYRLVDHLGRTHNEALEDKLINGEMGEQDLDGAEREEEKPDVVSHPTIKPIWLLRFFTSWGTRWGHVTNKENAPAPVVSEPPVKKEEGPL